MNFCIKYWYKSNWHCKKCLGFLKSDKNFRLRWDINEKLAGINDFDFYFNSALIFINDVESGKEDLFDDYYLDITRKIIVLVYRYLEDSIDPKKPPKEAEAQLPWPSTPNKQTNGTRENLSYKPYKSDTGGKIELY